MNRDRKNTGRLDRSSNRTLNHRGNRTINRGRDRTFNRGGGRTNPVNRGDVNEEDGVEKEYHVDENGTILSEQIVS
ncbi:MAG: hypothetical protein QNJ55_13075 [Xenococcus sp. MO_188.B8]|nr:hypothetical protein [Xenococcus sp. MO_188.B8]